MEKIKYVYISPRQNTHTRHNTLCRRLISNTTATASLQSLQLYEHTSLGAQLSRGDHEGQSIYDAGSVTT